ncbi:DUF397 domain-containing protein [Streptomyces sp. NPDC000151]|uniref:DUF397 domain-containing protein n=1 Tax=Streptomyces sp. NPDC000151 TaxID=3154244 RepID=UPI0033238233
MSTIQYIWRKSSHSAETECVEVAETPHLIAIRDSKDPDGPAIAVTPAAFAAFIAYVR